MPWNLILADDNIMTKKVFELALEGEDIKIHYAKDGESALDLIDGINPEIVVVDTKLPKISGTEICRKLKKEKPYIYLILLKSPFVEAPLLEEVEVDEIVEKPFRASQIKLIIEKARQKILEGPTPKHEIVEETASPTAETEQSIEEMKTITGDELSEEELQAKTWESPHSKAEVFDEDLFPEEEGEEGEIPVEEKLEEVEMEPEKVIVEEEFKEEAPLIEEPFVEEKLDEEEKKEPLVKEVKEKTMQEAKTQELVEKFSKEIIEKVAWEVIPPLAEKIIREEIEKLKREIEEES